MPDITKNDILTKVMIYFNALDRNNKALFQSDLALVSRKTFETFMDLWQVLPSKPDSSEYVYYLSLAANVTIIDQSFVVEETQGHLIIHT